VGTVRNIGPERISVPLLGRDIDPDEVVEVPDEYLEDYAWPEETWKVEGSADDPRTVAELRDQLKARDLPTSGTKKELTERLAQAGTEPGE
jgi:hypothetical protein